jgi:transcriptional regulator with XRE-family HTH domain
MYEVFCNLLEKHNVTAYKVAKETGISTATLTDWKMGRSTPKQDKLQKIAEYFGVSLDYLMGIEREEGNEYYLNDETKKIAQEIFMNKDMRILFDIARNTSPERLKTYAEFLKKMQEHDGE